METPIWAIALFIIVSVISAFATFFVKLGAPKVTRKIRKLVRNWQFFLGIFIYGIATILSLFALKAGELSVLYPFVALQYVWANMLSKKYLGEKITALKWAGIALIFAGVSLIGVGA
ncbi:EamA family transporter [Candidatus Woesearchaeota archaeon]|nr:EamA family transporter [Candidatus Woesearchaeota archaeon]